jgi:hypothetical protein
VGASTNIWEKPLTGSSSVYACKKKVGEGWGERLFLSTEQN